MGRVNVECSLFHGRGGWRRVSRREIRGGGGLSTMQASRSKLLHTTPEEDNIKRKTQSKHNVGRFTIPSVFTKTANRTTPLSPPLASPKYEWLTEAPPRLRCSC